MSATLRHRLRNRIDSVVRVYDSTGQQLDYIPSGPDLGAFNDNGLEATDSILLDLPLPEVGGQTIGNTYVVEVASFSFDIPEFPIYFPDFDAESSCNENPDRTDCTNQDDGDYELFDAIGTPL